ncbi:MAG: dihydroxy-acid dehydratase, partial [Candidatus Latescibacteria bacterium]|nr:dihydroxy-acid dehydratase [Candidatus Latescibacterota bacterium]
MPAIIDAVKRGILEAGGMPLVFPTISLAEILFSPTTMMYRNLLAMDTEEMMRAQPMDAVVLVGGCDKTVPAQLMAAASANIPAISVVTGPMRTGSWQGDRIGACTDCRRYWMRFRAGEIDEDQIDEVEQSLCPTGGTCMVMGTASTMAGVTEALGMMLPGGAAAPSGSGDRLRHAVASGRHAVMMASKGSKPREVMTRSAFLNAITVLIAMGGSTNAVIHLIAIARRASVELSLEDFNRIAQRVPLLIDCKPSGRFYMEDLHAAGGIPCLLRALQSLLDLEAITVTGDTLGTLVSTVAEPPEWQEVIHSVARPLGPTESLVILKGNLAPDGAVIKKSAATPSLVNHRGPAVVFDSPEDLAKRIDDPTLGITPNHVLILRNAGPVGSGMPEAGYMPIPRYLAATGTTDMVRVSDARMSGTAYGTVVLHCAPESAVGGPLALVRNGDMVKLSVADRRIDVEISDEELRLRRETFEPPSSPKRGWRRLYAEHVNQANMGADLDFLV